MRTLLITGLLVFAFSTLAAQAQAQIDEAAWQRKVEVKATNMPVVSALKMILGRSGISYVIDSDVPEINVSVDIYKQPLRIAFEEVIAQAGLTWRDDEGICRISSTVKSYTGTDKFKLPRFGDKEVDAGVNDSPITPLLNALLSCTGIEYVLDPGVENLKVTAELKSVPLEKALQILMDAAGATCRMDDAKTVHISLKQPKN